jgi:hypothetical protein
MGVSEFFPGRDRKIFQEPQKDAILVELKHVLVTFPSPRRKAPRFLSLVTRKAALKYQMSAKSFSCRGELLALSSVSVIPEKRTLTTLSLSLLLISFLVEVMTDLCKT